MSNATHSRPMTLDGLQAGGPATLDSFAHLTLWLPWRDEDGRKIPYRIDTLRPGWKDPAGRGTRSEARAASKRLLSSGQGGGIAIVLGAPEGGAGFVLARLDLDSCCKPNGALAPFARAEIAALPTYAEISPSGTGLKLYFLIAAANMPPLLQALGTDGNGKQRFGRAWKRGSAVHSPGIELYLGERWFAVTGKLLPGSPRQLAVVPGEAVLRLIRERGPAFKGGRARTSGRSERAIAWRPASGGTAAARPISRI